MQNYKSPYKQTTCLSKSKERPSAISPKSGEKIVAFGRVFSPKNDAGITEPQLMNTTKSIAGQMKSAERKPTSVESPRRSPIKRHAKSVEPC